ncbi:diguanylate cyclase [Pseudarthrobacter sp. NPDC058362]|uniref:GGDEF domain-containing protein n=1 Tax=unclassified Pseudarthrobacter TaxID=2647000 RepID=UPI00365B2CCF
MILDIATLRVAFVVIAVVQLFLFYFSAYRVTRSSYSGWWCVALGFFLAGSAAFLLDGTPHQAWANPVGNALLAHGGVAVWAGARSLRTAPPKGWISAAVPLSVLVAGLVDDPANNSWAGGAVFLAAMSFTVGLSARELWRLGPDYSRVRIPLASAAGILAAFYAARLAVFLAEGAEGELFNGLFGSGTTTLLSMMLLVVASYSMPALSSEQHTRALRLVASRDDLTGLLNRKAFLSLAAAQLGSRRAAGPGGALVLADLDHFKSVNDTYGHAAGDHVLQRFADACTATVRKTDLVGRYGGEEFVLLIPGADAERAEDVAAGISARLAEASEAEGFEMPTVSYGISTYDAGTSTLEDAIASADRALYVAKSRGRNRSARSEG